MRFKIEVDHRERFKPYAILLQRKESLEVVFCCLRSGDIRVGDLVVERKLLPDLFLTLGENRLFMQLRAMKAAHPRQLLIIERGSGDNEALTERLRGLLVRICAG